MPGLTVRPDPLCEYQNPHAEAWGEMMARQELDVMEWLIGTSNLTKSAILDDSKTCTLYLLQR